jgi:DNA-binding MarR family transcriptional regulator
MVGPATFKTVNGSRGRFGATGARYDAAASMPPDSVATVLAQWRRQRPGLDLGPLGLFAALAHAYWLTAPQIERLMADDGLTRGMFDVLTTLRRAGAPYMLSPKLLAQSLLLSGAGLTNRLDRLEANGLIVRLPDLRDRRALKIQLTPKGIKLVDKILPKLIRLETRLAAGLSAAQTSEFTRLLDIFAVTVQAARRKANGLPARPSRRLDSAAFAAGSTKQKPPSRSVPPRPR